MSPFEYRIVNQNFENISATTKFAVTPKIGSVILINDTYHELVAVGNDNDTFSTILVVQPYKKLHNIKFGIKNLLFFMFVVYVLYMVMNYNFYVFFDYMNFFFESPLVYTNK
jgi:hypothetical protein